MEFKTTKKIMVMDMEYGAVLESDDIRAMRSAIKELVSQMRVSFHNITIVKAPNHQVRQYLNQVARDYSISECDICGQEMKRKEIEYLEDSYGVCIMAGCKSCLNDDPSEENLDEAYDGELDCDDFDIDLLDEEDLELYEHCMCSNDSIDCSNCNDVMNLIMEDCLCESEVE